jgi:Flp pilus assembly protein TadB
VGLVQGDDMDVMTVLHSSTMQVVLLLLASATASLVVYFLASSMSLEKSTSRRLGKFAGTIPSNFTEEIGDSVLRFWRRDGSRLLGSLDWAQLGGHYAGWTASTLVGRGVIFGVGAFVAIFIASPQNFPLGLLVGALAGAFPVIQVNGKAGEVRKQVGREVPEIAALVAAELAAGNPPDVAIERAAQVPGPLGGLLSRALAEARSGGRPLFSRKPVRGTLVEVLLATGLSELVAFGAQLDLIASKGVSGAQMMAEISRAISREYYERVMAAAETLESKLVFPSAIFFFLPFTLAILLPVMTALSAAF